MATVSYLFDTQVAVFKKAGAGTAVGFKSKYKDVPHPATSRTIEGFKYDESRWGAEENDNFSDSVPTLWDPSTYGVKDYFVSGIGDGADLIVTTANSSLEDFQDKWRPLVKHGFYYIDGKEYYLYSDAGLISYVSSANYIASGGNYIQLQKNPKPGVPVLARGYKWDKSSNQYILDREIKKKIKFTGLLTEDGEKITETNGNIFWENVSTSSDEFILDYNTSPPTAIFNKDVTELVGKYLPASGLSLSDLQNLDDLGVVTSEANQQVHLTYSPIDRDSAVQIFTHYEGTSIQEWEVVDTLVSGVFNQVKIDYDLGIIHFGDSEQGGIPPYGFNIRAAYRKTVGIEYEPENSTDYISNVSADLNPVRRFTGNGFVYLRRDTTDVTRLVLSAELPEIEDSLYGPLYLGNAFARIKCEAYSDTNEAVEGATINFELLGIQPGFFGNDKTASAITNGMGVARTLYNPPRTINDLGGVTDVVTTVSGISSLFLENYIPHSSADSLFLFQVAREDHVLGIPKSSLNKYYEDFINSEGGGPEITWSIGDLGNYGWISGLLAPKIKWEIFHRAVHGLLTPITYESDDLRTGKKTVIAVSDPNAINPHTGTTPAIVPLQPESFTTTASGTYVYFDQELPQITDSGVVKSYMIVGPTKATIRANSYNARLNKTIYSNEIEVLIDIPDSAKGLYHIDTINAAPSGLLNNAYYYDQANVDLSPVNISASGLIPLGFRLRSSGITLASALDGITFLDLNPIDIFTAQQIAHTFEVD